MIGITIIAVGKIKEKYFTDALKEYTKRLSRFAKMNIIEVPDEKIPDNAYAAAMCIEGKPVSSEELAQKIADVSMTRSHIAFIIGGSLGLSDAVKSPCPISLCEWC